MTVPRKVLELVERFEHNIDAYKHGPYNETQVRREFIDPLFKSLGWDIDNEQGYAEAYKDVVHEDAIKVGRATKAPDYSFRIGGVRKFFVEAKKPSVDIKADIHPAYQLRRYAWSAKLPLSILTDFEEFAVYDCRIKPEKADKASKARTLYLTYTDYVERWDELTNIFSRDAILKGSFDKYAQSHKTKKGTAEVDAAFLQEIERWRELLARNIALRNPRLSRRELNFAVQRTIDRIIFLRICEDRGIETYGKLMALQNGVQVYQRLLKLFYQADDRYNSGIFHFTTEQNRVETPDALTPELTIDDKLLQEIIKHLYYPDSPYEFSVLPADILGQVYEQFLGKVIRLTAGHQAKVEEKPEVKKAGGVYYTPTYIVEYIVKNTVGTLLEDKTPKQAEKLRILDPACGSGSFLLGAYQYLLDWHLSRYLKDPQKWAKGRRPRLYQNDRGEWKLTIDERKRLLLNNIYGVDIDTQAVEVTKLSLLLKVLEGEDEQTLSSQLSLFKARVLPDLSHNIKCGNSLIGSDFYEGKQLTWLDEEEMYRINVFDWDKEFPEIMQAGGFDAVIGNPPYGAKLSSLESDYLRQKYITAEYQVDTYPLFIEKSYHSIKQQGYFGMIVPSAWVASQYNEILRRFLVSNTELNNIVIAPKNVFIDATVETLILIWSKSKFKGGKFTVERWDQDEHISYFLEQNDIEKQKAYIFPVYSDSEKITLVEKIRSFGRPLSKYADAVWGVKIYQKGKGKPKQKGNESKTKCFHSPIKTKEIHKPLLGGKEIQRYRVDWKGTYVDYGEWLAEPRTPLWFKGHRILVREVTDKGTIQATIVDDEFVFSNSVDGIKLKEEKYALAFILGIINSKLISFYHLNTSANAFKGAFPKVLIKDLLNIPISAIDLTNSTDKAHHDKMVELVERMLDLYKHLHDTKMPQAQTFLQRQIEATDRQIDRLVYELYGLTKEEIEIVETP